MSPALSIRPILWGPGLLAGLTPILIASAALVGLLAVSDVRAGLDFSPYIWRAIRFTLFQAALSALLSVALAIPLARALARRAFPGRGVFLALLGAPFILPVIVAILGILAVWGRAGWLNTLLSGDGPVLFNIYGLSGVLLAHVFFNLPLATRILLQGWQGIPSESWRLAAQLGMGTGSIFRHLECPMLRERIPGALALIFLLCVTSFAVVLALGGGPKATTIELAIYESLRLDFNLKRAASLAIIQITLCAGLAVAIKLFTAEPDLGAGFGTALFRPDSAGAASKAFDTIAILAAILFLGLPLLAAALRGIPILPDVLVEPTLWHATLRSLVIALSACCLGVLIAIPLLRVGLRLNARQRWWVEVPGFVILVAPPIALGAGLFVVLHRFVPVDDLALPLTALLNGLASLPFILGLMLPALRRVDSDYGRLLGSLNIGGLRGFWPVLWPMVRKPFGTAVGISAALSAGDLGVIALFGSPEAPTLPLYLYQQMGAYRMEPAFGAALVLVMLSFGLFVFFDRVVGGHDQN